MLGSVQVPPLSAETVASSRQQIDYPEIARLHASSALTTPEEVAAWRGALEAPPLQRAGPLYPLRPHDSATSRPRNLGEVIRQRVSTRRFAGTPIAFAQLSAILDHSTTGLPSDFLDSQNPSLLDIYIIANAVQGLPSGSYFYTPHRQALEHLRQGDFREEAGHLCFEQALGADASAVVFFMADLKSVLQRFGNRGYRAVQLEAGTVGGKLYLCAFASGVGASGLTFYDDDVTDFFSPHAAGKAAIFVIALGITAGENRVRPFRSHVGMRLDALSRRDS
ncbi:hypothetical protein NKDENANG_02646 [Candidatus Entotheonellaceae bacterium PAL068K]